VDIIFKGRHTDVLERFRKHATAKLTKIEKLDAKAIRVDVEVSTERNPRQSGRKERVELTITSSGPTIRAEAAAEERFTALDMALAKLESRLRRANDRRKSRHAGRAAVRLTDRPEVSGPAVAASGPLFRPDSGASDGRTGAPGRVPGAAPGGAAQDGAAQESAAQDGAARESAMPDDVVPIAMEGDGPLVVREKFHGASPMAIDQALLAMELVGHDFFLFRDAQCGHPSVVYRRRGYQYGVIRLVEESADGPAAEAARTAAREQRGGLANGQSKKGARLGTG
jgi:ribosomal subunit interface protein